MIRSCLRRVSLLVTLTPLLLASPASAQRGALTLPQNVAQLSGRAATIVHAHVLAARVEPHPQYTHLQTVVVTLAVDGVLKGSAGRSLTFREFIWDPRDIADRAGYNVGDEMVLFLNAPTAAGFQTPVGLEQGRFRVKRDAQGPLTVVNGQGNEGLFTGVRQLSAASRLSSHSRQVMAQREKVRGAIPLDVLTDSIRAFASQKVAQ